MLSFFPLDVLAEIWDVIESVSEGFLTYSYRIMYPVQRQWHAEGGQGQGAEAGYCHNLQISWSS